MLYKNLILLLVLTISTISPVSYEPYLQFHAVDANEQNNKDDKPELQLNPLTKNQLRMIAAKILENDSYSYNSSRVNESFIKSSDAIDLTVKPSELCSIFGEASFYALMVQPLVSIDDIKKRQEVIATMVEDKELYMSMQSHIQHLRELEPYALHYFMPKNPVIEQLVDKAYFPAFLGRLNKSSVALDIKTRLDNCGFLLTMFSLPIEFFTLINSVKYNLVDGNVSLKDRLKDFLKIFVPLNFKRGEKTYKIFLNEFLSSRSNQMSADVLPQNIVELITLIQALPQEAKSKMWEALSAKAMVGIGASVGLIASVYCYSIYVSYSQQKLLHDITMFLQKQLISLRNYLECVHSLYMLLKDHPQLHHLESFKKLELFFDKEQQSPRLKEIVARLKTHTFEGKESLFSLSGRILATHKIMQESYQELKPLFVAAGEIDAFFAAARLYENHQKTPATFCFASFVESDKPYIKVKEFWNPLIDAHKVVTNDLTLGHDDATSLIVTGPNTAGKTTLLKGLMDAVLYAHVYGIAPAGQLVCTNFHVLNCYLNITDNLKEGHSLFQAEVLRAGELIKGINSLQPHQFAFTIIDELFTGTAPEEGAQGAVRFTQKVTQYQNSICLFATHFKELTALEKSISSLANYYVPVIKQADGTLYRPFKLERGINNLNIALDLLTMAGLF